MTVTAGIVGWGSIAQRHASALQAAGARLGGVVSRSRRPPDGLRRYASLEAMLPNVDAVTVAVPNHLHADCCLAAVSAGRAVLVEKPLVIDERQLALLDAALPAASTPVFVGFRLRWNRSLRRLRSELRRPDRIECSYDLGIDHLADGKDWTRRVDVTGGAFFTLGVHMLDLARWLYRLEGEPLTGLSAQADGWHGGADYPLRVRLRGCVRGSASLVAATDTRGDVPYRITVAARGRGGGGTSQPLTLDASSEPAEYEAMMLDFVQATANRTVDCGATREILQSHRELLQARALAGTSPPEPTPRSRRTERGDA